MMVSYNVKKIYLPKNVVTNLMELNSIKSYFSHKIFINWK